MIEWLRGIVTPDFEDDELNRRAFNLNMVLVVLSVAIGLGIVAMLFQLGSRPLSYVLPNTLFLVGAILVLGLCYALSRRGRVQIGAFLFVGMLTVACVGAILVGGTAGALPAILIIPVAVAGATLGSRASVALAALSMIALVMAGVLEINGVITVVYPATDMTILLNVFDVGFGLFFATMGIWLASYSLQRALERSQQAVVEANGYRQDLQQSLSAEQRNRDRLQRAIGEYTAFLERIGRGDYEARLSLADQDQSLSVLEQHINATVDTLVSALEQSESALREAEAAHQRYVLQEWRSYLPTLATRDFEVTRPGETIDGEEVWAALGRALDPQQPVALAEGDHGRDGGQDGQATLAVPIRLRDQVMGVFGVSRKNKDGGPWSEAERMLIEAVVERLALTADGIRLLEDVQHSAARERFLSEVTARMRETLDTDAVLQTAIREIGEALNLAEVEVRMGIEGTTPEGGRGYSASGRPGRGQGSTAGGTTARGTDGAGEVGR